jgi:hypothetical protein
MEKDKIIKFEKSKKVKEKNNGSVAKSNFNSKVQDGTIVLDMDYKIYRNHYFGFEIKVPDNWITLDHNELVKIAQENFNKLNISEVEKIKILEAMTTNNISLFNATPFLKGTKQPYGKNQRLDNPSLNCTAQKITMYPNHTSSDFIEGMRGHLKNGSMGIKYGEVSNANTVIISGKRFDTIEAKAFINDGRDIVYSKCYSILKNGYQLLIITSSISEDGSEDLSKIVNNIKLD